MLVVVVLVDGVTVPVVEVVDVVAVADRLMPAARTVAVDMRFGGHMLVQHTLVVMLVVAAVRVTIVQVVDMVRMAHAGVPASLAMSVLMLGVLAVLGGGGHQSPSVDPFDSRNSPDPLPFVRAARILGGMKDRAGPRTTVNVADIVPIGQRLKRHCRCGPLTVTRLPQGRGVMWFQLRYVCQGPVMANVGPGTWMLTKRILPSGVTSGR